MTSSDEPSEDAWRPDEVATMSTAVSSAPSVHNIQPWSVEVRGRTAFLLRRSGLELEEHDPQGRDRDISCGAALANLTLAVRHLGLIADVDRDPGGGVDVVATVTRNVSNPAGPEELRWFEAVPVRISHRRAFTTEPVSEEAREAFDALGESCGVCTRWVRETQETHQLARSLVYAATVYRADRRYQRELSAWTAPRGSASDEGIPEEALGARGVPAIGLTTSRTALPDEYVLAARIAAESVVVVSSGSDDRASRVRAGEAMEYLWLDAVSRGLAASVMTQPLRLGEVRRRVTEVFGVESPQLLMRFGYAASPAGERSGRRRTSDSDADVE